MRPPHFERQRPPEDPAWERRLDAAYIIGFHEYAILSEAAVEGAGGVLVSHLGLLLARRGRNRHAPDHWTDKSVAIFLVLARAEGWQTKRRVAVDASRLLGARVTLRCVGRFLARLAGLGFRHESTGKDLWFFRRGREIRFCHAGDGHAGGVCLVLGLMSGPPDRARAVTTTRRSLRTLVANREGAK